MSVGIRSSEKRWPSRPSVACISQGAASYGGRAPIKVAPSQGRCWTVYEHISSSCLHWALFWNLHCFGKILKNLWEIQPGRVFFRFVLNKQPRMGVLFQKSSRIFPSRGRVAYWPCRTGNFEKWLRAHSNVERRISSSLIKPANHEAVRSHAKSRHYE